MDETNGYGAPLYGKNHGNYRKKYSPEVIEMVCKRWRELTNNGKTRTGKSASSSWVTISKETGLSHGQVRSIVVNYARSSRVSSETSDKVNSLIGTGTYDQIARTVGVSERTVSLVATKTRSDESSSKGMQQMVTDAQHALQTAKPVRVLELENERMRKFISSEWKPPLRIAVASDLHFPFQSKKAIDDLLAATGKFDFLILVGDIYDMYHFSTFRKEAVVPFSREFQESIPVWDKLVKKFGRIIYIAGSNHERRLWMRLTERASLFTLGLDAKAQEILYEAIDKIRDLYLNINSEAITPYYGWWLRFGNVIFAHPDRFLRRTMGTAEEVSKYFMNRYIDFETLICAHTHRLSGFSPLMGKWLAEIPAMCGPMDYMADGHAKIGSLHNGHAIVCIGKDGRLDYNNSKIHFSGVWGSRKLITTMGGIE